MAFFQSYLSFRSVTRMTKLSASVCEVFPLEIALVVHMDLLSIYGHVYSLMALVIVLFSNVNLHSNWIFIT